MTTVRLDLDDEDLEKLRRIAKHRNTTMTEALRGAIGTENYILDLYATGKMLLWRRVGSHDAYEISLYTPAQAGRE